MHNWGCRKSIHLHCITWHPALGIIRQKRLQKWSGATGIDGLLPLKQHLSGHCQRGFNFNSDWLALGKILVRKHARVANSHIPTHTTQLAIMTSSRVILTVLSHSLQNVILPLCPFALSWECFSWTALQRNGEDKQLLPLGQDKSSITII